MRVLIFQAGVTAVAAAAMNAFADAVRAEGHFAGIRSLPHFRREKEPADRIFIALTPAEADQYKNLGVELVQVFQDTDMITPIQLPDDEEELKDFDFSKAIGELDGKTAGSELTLDQLRAAAIERALEVNAQTTREQLEHMLALDVPHGRQADDRITDARNADGVAGDRIGVRTSTVLPNVNGLDLERMNDDQLRATAVQLGISVGKNISRSTLINKMTKTFAEKVSAPEDSAPQSPAESYDDDLADLDEAGLKAVGEREEVDFGRTASADGMTKKIVEARKAKAQGETVDG